MKRIHLSEKEKTHLESLHYSSNNGKQRDRIKAVLLRSEGWSVPKISQALRIHETTVPSELILDTQHITKDAKQKLRKTHQALDPFELRKQIEGKLKLIFNLVEANDLYTRVAI